MATDKCFILFGLANRYSGHCRLTPEKRSEFQRTMVRYRAVRNEKEHLTRSKLWDTNTESRYLLYVAVIPLWESPAAFPLAL
jgi:hypothetical protein